MTRQEAKRLIEETFQRPFDEERFRYFIRNLLNDIDEKFNHPNTGAYIPHSFKDHINKYKRIAKYTDPEGNRLDILIVHLKKETSLDRARTMQRNFVAHYLKKRGEKDAALVAFYNDKLKDWRFSFVRMEYRTVQTESGRVRVREELTPARRYSFLVGENEPNHTAQQQLVPILEDDRNNPGLADIEQAFNIETVTREFFLKYRGLFLKVKEELDEILSGNRRVRKEFESKQIDTANFAKNLLGQIVFLYFLQKKGWLGVERGQPWGTGPRNFLRKLFEKEIVDYDNYFNEILEPLFYEALAIDRGEDSFYDRFTCKIPFLNGGLFEPIGDYDWRNTDILLENETFREILDTFDLYNFTVREDEPLEKEVAVDPEMLGKVFENLLEVKDRKSKGAYYTPREIVHYMCQESLINYLDTAINTQEESLVPRKAVQKSLIGDEEPEQPALTTRKYRPVVPREDIEEFIRHGEVAIDNDTAKIKGTKSYSYKLPKSIREHAKLIDEKLADIKICDPAIGSGAFPVGMMHEIVKARQILTTYLGNNKKRTPYYFKRHAIQNSIYGVDIDPGAIDIAKLRLWLSLVVDEDDYKSIKPLPNLDYKIVCGNSLLGVEQNLLNSHLFRELEKLKPQYFEETDPEKKKELKARIDSLIKEITNNDEHFDFRVYFSEVFHSSPNSPLDKGGKGGFDVVIANPPYISHDRINYKREIKKRYNSYEPFADIYCYFIEKAMEIQNEKGLLCFITSNSYLKSQYGYPLRKLIKEKNDILQIINIEDFQIFDSAIVNSVILLSQNKNTNKNPICLVVNEIFTGNIDFKKFVDDNKFYYSQNDFLSRSWALVHTDKLKIKKKIESAGRTLEGYSTKIRLGLATGANYAFIINEQQKQRFLKKDPKNKEIIKPILRGRDIFRYAYKEPNLYILLTKNEINVKKDYPDIYEYLDSFGEKFKKRGAKGKHWSNLRACSFFDDFKKEKIIWIELTDKGRFALCRNEIYLLNTAYFLIPPDIFSPKYLLGILNSTIIEFYLHLIAETSGMGTTRWINIYVKQFPIPEISFEEQKPIIHTVDRILSITSDDDYLQNPEKQAEVKELEKEIDRMVYELYELTPEEIEIVEGK